MRPSFLLPLISVCVCASAQQAVVMNPVVEACPVGFGAQVNGRAIVRSIEDQREHGDTPLLDLTFQHGGSPIVSANVTVHGWARSDRFMPVFNSSDGAVAAQSFQLVSENKAGGLKESELRPDKVLFVDWAEVTELKYADGSAWHKSSDMQCRAEISKLRLVNVAAEAK